MRNIGMSAALALLLTLASSCAVAQQKPVRVLISLASGGSLDMTTRLFADKLRISLGQPVIAESRAGASGLIAIDALKSGPADGSLLMTAVSGTITLLPNTFKNPRFDPTKDFMPVAQFVQLDFVLTIYPGAPANTPAEFAALARRDPKYRTFGSAPGTNPQLLAIAFSRAAGVEVVHVPYKGNGQAITDLIGGQISAIFLTAGEALQLHRSGKARMLATSGARRSSLMPDVPTLRESGYDVEGSSWSGFFAPLGTPEAVIDRLERAVVEAAASTDLRERLANIGIEAVALSRQELAAKIRSEYQQIGNDLRASGFEQVE